MRKIKVVQMENTVTLAEASMMKSILEGAVDDLVQALKNNELFRVFLKSCKTLVANRIAQNNHQILDHY